MARTKARRWFKKADVDAIVATDPLNFLSMPGKKIHYSHIADWTAPEVVTIRCEFTNMKRAERFVRTLAREMNGGGHADRR